MVDSVADADLVLSGKSVAETRCLLKTEKPVIGLDWITESLMVILSDTDWLLYPFG